MKMIFPLILSRFLTMVALTSEVEGVLTGRIPYDSWKTVPLVICGAIAWGMGDLITAELSKAKEK